MKVDGQLQTNVPHVWAVGDVAATPLQLAHVVVHRGIAVAERIAGLGRPGDRLRGHPAGHLLHAGDRLRRADRGAGRERGHRGRDREARLPAIGKANIVGEGGFVKVVAEDGGGPVLGVHMIGPARDRADRRGRAHHNWEATPAEVAALIHPHPTLSEAIGEAYLALAGKPLHTA